MTKQRPKIKNLSLTRLVRLKESIESFNYEEFDEALKEIDRCMEERAKLLNGVSGKLYKCLLPSDELRLIDVVRRVGNKGLYQIRLKAAKISYNNLTESYAIRLRVNECDNNMRYVVSKSEKDNSIQLKDNSLSQSESVIDFGVVTDEGDYKVMDNLVKDLDTIMKSPKKGGMKSDVTLLIDSSNNSRIKAAIVELDEDGNFESGFTFGTKKGGKGRIIYEIVSLKTYPHFTSSDIRPISQELYNDLMRNYSGLVNILK